MLDNLRRLRAHAACNKAPPYSPMKAFWVTVLLTALLHEAHAGGIRLIETKLVDEDGPEPYVLRNISTQPADQDEDEPKGVSIWVRHPPGQHGDKPFLANKDGTIAAINIRPATKWEMVYLLLSLDDENITIVANFNARIAKLCAAAKHEINDREIEIENIEGNVLTVWSREYAQAIYSLKVKVLPDGQLELLSYERKPY
ncbi:hypothetical protein AYO49_02320 [Verrucomicrobiaceae bacterium SCGC AG-212-N21]|nr:hypothetical protein AYO49_02320 [Verrucomicrobiaceae bacterium SCGC AG-212-N21]